MQRGWLQASLVQSEAEVDAQELQCLPGHRLEMKLLFRSPTKQRRQRNRHYWQTCARKRGYKNAAHARKSAARAGHQHRAYACPICGRWHLTKTAKEA